MKKIIFTGGGSGGHVVPALTLISKLPKDIELLYIGGSGIEEQLVKDRNINFKKISTGKLRRYLSLQNIIDMFKVALGIIQSIFILIRYPKSTIIFSTGGFVSVPVVLGAVITGKKVYLHEQTSRVGLANKIASKFASKVFISFEESFNFFPKDKTLFSGYPVRDECYTPSPNELVIHGVDVLEKKKNKKVLFLTGGGNGAKLLNDVLFELKEKLENDFFIIHQVGKAFIQDYERYKSDSYLPLAFLGQEMIDLLKVSDVVISRAGAGTVCELLAIGKPSIFIPLKIAQKNEQYHNAMEAHKKLNSIIIEEDNLNQKELSNSINEILQTKRSEDIGEKSKGSEIILNQILQS